MKLRALALASCLIGGMAVSSASAVPLTQRPVTAGENTAVELAQIRKGPRFKNRGFNRGYNNYRNHRVRRGPPGWHRYSYRPRDYRSRGCIIIGPIWYCP